jgi:hypothetical protein
LKGNGGKERRRKELGKQVNVVRERSYARSAFDCLFWYTQDRKSTRSRLLGLGRRSFRARRSVRDVRSDKMVRTEAPEIGHVRDSLYIRDGGLCNSALKFPLSSVFRVTQ